MIEGRLGYNRENKRYGLLVMDLWEVDSFHCGQGVNVKIAGEWVDTRFEMNPAGQWYLVGTDLVGDDLEFIIKNSTNISMRKTIILEIRAKKKKKCFNPLVQLGLKHFLTVKYY